MVVLAVTGPIGVGKSTVMQILADLGFSTLKADEIVRSERRKGGLAYDAIVEAFGVEILDTRGEIDATKLADLALNSSENLAALEAILHPLVKTRIQQMIASSGDNESLAIELPLLKSDDPYLELVDHVIYVTTRPELARERVLATRSISADSFNKFRSAQPEDDQYFEVADSVVINDSDEEQLVSKVRSIVAAND